MHYTLIKHGAILGNVDPAGRSIQQFQAKVGFELLNQLGDGSATHAKCFSGFRKTSRLDYSYECLHAIEPVHVES